MAEAIAPDEKQRRFDAALDELQRTAEAGGVVPAEIFNEFLMAAQNDRSDTRYKTLLEAVGKDSDSGAVERSPGCSWWARSSGDILTARFGITWRVESRRPDRGIARGINRANRRTS
jgi:hypothetical protein